MTTTTILTGRYNSLKQVYEASNTATWATMPATWALYTAWNSSPSTVSLQLDDDLGSVSVRIPRLAIAFSGEATYELKVSTTGAFAGEETTVSFVLGTSYTVPQARYYRWTITVITGSTGLLPEIRSVQPSYSTEVVTEYLRNIDTSTLSGTISARQVVYTLGTVYSCDITSYDSTSWVDRAYAVPDSYSVATISPVAGIVSNSPLTIVLRDYFGVPVNGIVDITIRGVPKIAINGSLGIDIL